MNKDTFSGYHPIVNMTYFTFVLGFTMILSHPICLIISFFSAFSYAIFLNGRKALRFNLLYLLPLLLTTALLNPLFSHRGMTILAYLPDGNPLTLESIFYGLSASFMLITVISWFSCFNIVMTSDKFIYLFGKITPSFSLVLSMSLRFVPRFKTQMKLISDSQKCIGRDISNGNLFKKIRHGIRILSALMTWALENAVDTADSMKSRGYGLPGRSAFSLYRIDKRDISILLLLFTGASGIVIALIAKVLKFSYYPLIKSSPTSVGQFAVFFLYLFLCSVPLLLNGKEYVKWKLNTRSISTKTAVLVSQHKI